MQRIGSRAQVMHSNAKMTGGGLKKKDLKYNKQGKIVSKKMSAMAKKEKRLQKAGYTTKKGQFGAVRTMRGGAGKMTKSSYCNNCGIPIDSSTFFCTSCGYPNNLQNINIIISSTEQNLVRKKKMTERNIWEKNPTIFYISNNTDSTFDVIIKNTNGARRPLKFNNIKFDTKRRSTKLHDPLRLNIKFIAEDGKISTATLKLNSSNGISYRSSVTDEFIVYDTREFIEKFEIDKSAALELKTMKTHRSPDVELPNLPPFKKSTRNLLKEPTMNGHVYNEIQEIEGEIKKRKGGELPKSTYTIGDWVAQTDIIINDLELKDIPKDALYSIHEFIVIWQNAQQLLVTKSRGEIYEIFSKMD
jgi:hypothetical protein